MKLVGRHEEIQIMNSLLVSGEPEMLALIGRRRVGKTYLIKEVYRNHTCFEMTGIKDATLKEQLYNFTLQLKKYTQSKIDLAIPDNWITAFDQLSIYLSGLKTKKKKVVFFDELPWLASHRSGFLQALGHFWNNWAVNENVILVICGSAASWMINKVVNNKGGLHNRITKLINLEPFTLAETEEFFKSKNISLNRYQIAQLYMVMGGIPHYLKEITKGMGAVQNIESICFSKHGLLKNEFRNLYQALFDKATHHETIVRALAKKWKGLTRNEIVTYTKLSDGGSLSRYLEELETSGFITQYQPFAKAKKDALFRLTDEYSLFYLHFIEKQKPLGLQNLISSREWKAWTGFAFESLCMKNVGNIKRALGISGMETQAASFVQKGNNTQEGFQIDMLIDRKDGNINLCEMKFYDAEFSLDKSYALNLRNKIAGFREASKTRKHIFLTLISPFGIKKNQNSLGLIDNNIALDALFKK
jgi:AAA+ ATPase superfamily predicted ATPase